ncbi:bifunctional diguanylate cyclase/phosphodiesterase [Bradyrhizobium sp. USDA 4520]
MLLTQVSILRSIANGTPVEETAHELCTSFEKLLPGTVCTVMSVDAAGLLHPLAAPSLPETFLDAIDGVMIGPDVGSCGTAAYLRTPVLVTNIEHDPRWSKYRDRALALGLKACWSSPVTGENGVPLGVVALYYREPRGPKKRERKTIATCVELCELALRRHERVVDRERRAYVDALTGLPNRAAFNAALARVPCEQPGSWALFVIDLDNLKTINDTFGHQAGDALIRTASCRIAKAMSPDVTFRLGGDEFAVIVQSADALKNLDNTAAKIFEALEVASDCDGHSVVPAATMGGAVFETSGLDAETVYKNADFALYHAKETGRGGFIRYWPGIGTRITHRRDSIRNVSEALDDQRIDAHYQPVVRLDTGEIVGVEALCRLTTASGQVMPAKTFQDATSDAQVASELTERMLAIAAADVRRWLDDGIPFQHVAVNVSTADFYTGDLRRKLEESFGRAGVSLNHLILEVNEDVYVGRRDKVVEREIAALRKSGLRVALDDFGTGYASLTHLLTTPVDIIKIDRSFITRLWPDDPSMVIVQGLIDIARQLDIRVVAEGIEAEVQASQLWTMGCQLGQGFAFSPAVNRHEVRRLLRRHAQGVEGAVPLYVEPVRLLRAAPSGRARMALASTG